jgi:hypothetical protein
MPKFTSFLLPIHWAPYFLYADATGYSDEELNEMDEWDIMHAPGPCVAVGEPGLTLQGADGPLLAERAEFTFQTIEELVSDGEVIAYQ